MNTARPYHQTARAEATRRTRDALFAEARRVFYAGEWDACSLEEIAAGAGTTKQTLLRHFGSKQGLFDAAGEHWRHHVAAQRGEAPVGDVEGAVDNLLDHYEETGVMVLRLLGMQAAAGSLDPTDRADRREDQLALGRELHYAWVDRVFAPWLAPLPRAARARRRALLIAQCDVYTWRILALDLQLPRRELRRTLVEGIQRLLAEAP